MIPVIVFDVWSDFAHFKKNYTTTSPISYGIPPRSTLAGLIAAIVGLGRQEYYKQFTLDKSRISLQLLSPIKRIQLTESFVWTKEDFYPAKLSIKVGKNNDTSVELTTFSGQNPHILVRIDFVKDPKYRIYFSHSDERLMKKLEELLREHKTIYTPYLGITELVANFEYIGTYTAEKVTSDDFIELHTIAPLSAVEKIDVTGEHYKERDRKKENEIYVPKLAVESMPIYINEERVAEKYDKIVYNEEGKPMFLKPKKHLWKLSNEEHIMFFSGE